MTIVHPDIQRSADSDLMHVHGPVTDQAIATWDGTVGDKLRDNAGWKINATTTKLQGKASFSPMASTSSSGTITLNLNTDNIHLVNLSGNGVGALSNVSVGQRFAVRLKPNGHDWDWWDGIHWPSDIEPELPSISGRWSWFGFICTGTGEYGAGEFDGFVLGEDYRP